MRYKALKYKWPWPFMVTQGRMWWCHWTPNIWFPMHFKSDMTFLGSASNLSDLDFDLSGSRPTLLCIWIPHKWFPISVSPRPFPRGDFSQHLIMSSLDQREDFYQNGLDCISSILFEICGSQTMSYRRRDAKVKAKDEARFNDCQIKNS